MITKEKLENYLAGNLMKKEIAEKENVTIATVTKWIQKYKLGHSRRSLKNCVICEKELCGSQTKFCSKTCACKYGNANHQTYSKQQQRGVKRKLELIAFRGSKCERCGYDKNLASLQFHHINPLEKDTNMDMRKLSNSTSEWCLNELNKCLVLCANCHGEEHSPHLNLKELLGEAGIEPALSGLSSQP